MKKILTILAATWLLSGCVGNALNRYYDGVSKCGSTENTKPVYNSIGWLDHVECVKATEASK